MLVESATIRRRDFEAAMFDLDGVLTDTARVHAAAWKTVFDAFLQIRHPVPNPFEETTAGGNQDRCSSSSRNARAILRAAGLEHHIDVCVDELDAEKLGVPGKPDQTLFLEAARRLGVQPPRVILFEDALAGVEAGERGGFGRVVGINPGEHAEALRRHGADAVIQSLLQIEVEDR
jgi:beta-phosphoglucomutase-like phosphatase (HAD superfamily)